MSSPLLETSVDGARSILLSITGGPDMSLLEVSEAAKVVQEAAHPDANIIFGANVDDTLGRPGLGDGDRDPLRRPRPARRRQRPRASCAPPGTTTAAVRRPADRRAGTRPELRVAPAGPVHRSTRVRPRPLSGPLTP